MSNMRKFIFRVRHYGLSAALRRTWNKCRRRSEHEILKLLPRGPICDRYFAFLHFRLFHDRNPVPSAKRLNDYLYSLKVNGELENPLRAFVTDKEFVKLFVKAVVGDKYNVPTIAVLRSAAAVRSYSYPARCCIKSTHGTGQTIIRRSAEPIEIEKIVSWLSYDHYKESGEHNYKKLEPKIIVEPLVFDQDILEDYKIFCFNGHPRLIQVDIDRFTKHKRKLYTPDWTDTGCSIGYPVADIEIRRPTNLDEMLQVSIELSRYFSSIRVDLYTNGKQILVGELTSCHGGAAESFIPADGEEVISRICFNDI